MNLRNRKCNASGFCFGVMICHKIDIIYNCYSNSEICLFIIGELERDFRNSRENLFTREIFHYEIGRVI
ncbi:hypothetical protein CN425_16735 [Bacillus cereus]|uniref:Uncharacterized protein n=1 Tax=Bacillus cereus TaxID=1396 RepID=A0A2A8PTC5_BACCE|nr:hypothetical protein CN425_16735 [Bacillus cereus]